MESNARVGVFICKCGDKIEPFIDLNLLQDKLLKDQNINYCEIMPYSCLKPGIENIYSKVINQKLNRVIIAGCESRLMLKKLEKELEPLDLKKGQIDIVNIRGHVASVSDISSAMKADKSAKLIKASAAEMVSLAPTIQSLARIEGPVMILGSGFASYTAAHELINNGFDCLLPSEIIESDFIINNLHLKYPGEYVYYDKLKLIRKELSTSKHVSAIPPGELIRLSGVTGDYKLTFSENDSGKEKSYKAGAIIACIDSDLKATDAEFWYDGQKVICQTEIEEIIQNKGIQEGKVVFWVNDYEAGYPEFSNLSSKSAWSMAKHIRELHNRVEVIILYNEQMQIPLSAEERSIGRKLGILWLPYDKEVRPSIQEGYITVCNIKDHVEYDISWDYMVLSPERKLYGNTLKTAQILGLVHKDGHFLAGRHVRVRPEMVGREEMYLAGSGKYPCNLNDALAQGYKAGKKTSEMLQKSKACELYLPRIVCAVDPQKCVGCGMCQELCDCGGIGAIEGTGGGLPRIVDPMICTGGGTCAASCPYHALILQNNTTDQREARIAALSRELSGSEVIGIACAWGGLPAADNAGAKGLKYDPRLHILGVPCVGQLDPCIFARAFLEGAPGLILIGCNPDECHHSYGIDHAGSRVTIIKKLLTMCGFDRRRIALAHADLNKPEEFIRTIESFTKTIEALGPIERNSINISKLESIYGLVKDNTRIRHLLCANLRRPWEHSYKGEPRHALEYDRDFSDALTEELLNTRVLRLLRLYNRPTMLQELSSNLMVDKKKVGERIWDMVNEGRVQYTHKDSEPMFIAHA
ncbi:MAG: hydrogenase iron-sulfur subunit [Desulfobacterales bacterium]|nr:hydrogenase iron-sulfur subunit [Desulfobacterales bacterium]MBF0397527.1 hydrogenase iron-sulfur subunit [Desulfobacterales bacterium]